MQPQTPAPRIKAYSYLRFSTPEQQKGDSFRRQASMATSYAARKGLELDTALTFHDLGVSAYKGANAETGKLADFLEAVRAGLVPQGSYLLVEALDRLSRMVPRHALRMLESIADAGVTVVTLNDGREYTSESLNNDPLDLMVAIMLFMRANEESTTKARRLSAAWEGKRLTASTKPLTSLTPAWVRLDRSTDPAKLVLIPERAVIVQRIFAEHLAGHGSAAIAQGLIKDGVPCFGRAAHWHRTYITKILGNSATYGVFTPHQQLYNGTKRTRSPLEPVEGYFPPAITQDTFEASQRLRGTDHKVKARAGQLVNLLGGLAVCPLCGSTMTRVNKGSPARGGKPKLVCVKAKAGAGCTYHGVPAEQVEAGILDKVAELLWSAPRGAVGLEDELAQLELAIDVTLEQVVNLTEALSGGPSRALTSKLREIESQLQDMETRKGELVERINTGASPVLEQRLKAANAALSEHPLNRPKANAALRSVLSSVVVGYTTGELLLNWKHGGTSSLTYAWPHPVGN